MHPAFRVFYVLFSMTMTAIVSLSTAGFFGVAGYSLWRYLDRAGNTMDNLGGVGNDENSDLKRLLRAIDTTEPVIEEIEKLKPEKAPSLYAGKTREELLEIHEFAKAELDRLRKGTEEPTPPTPTQLVAAIRLPPLEELD